MTKPKPNRVERIKEALAWEACNIAHEGRMIAGQLERIQHLREELIRAGKVAS